MAINKAIEFEVSQWHFTQPLLTCGTDSETNETHPF